MDKIKLTPSQQKAFEQSLSISILKSLRSDKLITDAQLICAIDKIYSQKACTSKSRVV